MAGKPMLYFALKMALGWEKGPKKEAFWDENSDNGTWFSRF